MEEFAAMLKRGPRPVTVAAPRAHRREDPLAPEGRVNFEIETDTPMQLEFLADPTIPASSVEEIRALGNLVRIHDEKDPVSLLEEARRDERIVLTFDAAYHDEIFEAGAPRPPGLVCFQIEYETPRDPAHLLAAILSDDDLEIDGFFTLLERDRMRQRPLESP